jgi:hypothetical protein
MGAMYRRLIVLTIAVAAAAVPAHGATLYKSVDANGTVMFSDTPPAGEARLLEQRDLQSLYRPASPATNSPSPMEQVFQMVDSDAALARANARVDMAEHALAEALRDLPPTHTVRLDPRRPSMADSDRIAFFKKDVAIARRELAAIVRDRQGAATSVVATR